MDCFSTTIRFICRPSSYSLQHRTRTLSIDLVISFLYTEGEDPDCIRSKEKKVVIVKSFSAGTAAAQVLGKNPSTLFGLQLITDDRQLIQGPPSQEDKELLERRLDCQKRLVVMKARNAETAEEREATSAAVIQQEDLQEWLDDLQLRLHQACAVASRLPAASGSSKGSSSKAGRSKLSATVKMMKAGESAHHLIPSTSSGNSSGPVSSSSSSNTLALHRFGR